MSVKSQLGQLRLKARLALFENNRPLSNYLLYRTYSMRAKGVWKKSARTIRPESAEIARQFAHEGVYLFSPRQDTALLKQLTTKVDHLFQSPDETISLEPGLLRLRRGYERLPELTDFFTGEIEEVIHDYYKSFFKLYSVNVYRTVPEASRPEKSFLWHYDNSPKAIIKLMVYLDEFIREENGAMKLKPKPISDELFRRGFWDRTRNQRFASVLEDPATTKILEGSVGTSILFHVGRCIHKATYPRIGHRDVVTFFIMPSVTYWKDHLKKNSHRMSLNTGYCENPFTDRSPATGEYI